MFPVFATAPHYNVDLIPVLGSGFSGRKLKNFLFFSPSQKLSTIFSLGAFSLNTSVRGQWSLPMIFL